MYFYYFLGYQLEAREDLTRAQKDARAMNTYCLALGNFYKWLNNNRKVYIEGGVPAFFKGNFSNMIRSVSSSLVLVLYDQFQTWFKQQYNF